MSYEPPIGYLVFAHFPMAAPKGREQAGWRPAVVVGMPDFVESPRYPGLILVPFTSQIEKVGASQGLYPFYAAGTGGLRVDSLALIDQIRYIDQARFEDAQGSLRQMGRFTAEEYEPIRQALAAMIPS